MEIGWPGQMQHEMKAVTFVCEGQMEPTLGRMGAKSGQQEADRCGVMAQGQGREWLTIPLRALAGA